MKSVLLYCGAALLCAGVGCSGGDRVHEVPVSGEVTVDGAPIPKGSITFIAVDGNTPAGGGVIKDGKYSAKVPPGKKIVLVLGNKVVGQTPADSTMPGSPMVDKLEMITPPAYNAQHLTPLKATITDEPKDNLDFDLLSSFQAK